MSVTPLSIALINFGSFAVRLSDIRKIEPRRLNSRRYKQYSRAYTIITFDDGSTVTIKKPYFEVLKRYNDAIMQWDK